MARRMARVEIVMTGWEISPDRVFRLLSDALAQGTDIHKGGGSGRCWWRIDVSGLNRKEVCPYCSAVLSDGALHSADCVAAQLEREFNTEEVSP